MFNARIFDNNNYVNQINTPMGFGRYPSGSSVPTLVVNNTSLPLEHRMVAPFRGDQSQSLSPRFKQRSDVHHHFFPLRFRWEQSRGRPHDRSSDRHRLRMGEREHNYLR